MKGSLLALGGRVGILSLEGVKTSFVLDSTAAVKLTSLSALGLSSLFDCVSMKLTFPLPVLTKVYGEVMLVLGKLLVVLIARLTFLLFFGF